jgi:hypothetical protein
MTSTLPTIVTIERTLETTMMSSVCSRFIGSSPFDSEAEDGSNGDEDEGGRDMTDATTASAKAEAEADPIELIVVSSLPVKANGSAVNKVWLPVEANSDATECRANGQSESTADAIEVRFKTEVDWTKLLRFMV